MGVATCLGMGLEGKDVLFGSRYCVGGVCGCNREGVRDVVFLVQAFRCQSECVFEGLWVRARGAG